MQRLTNTPEPRRRGILVAADDLALLAGHADDAVVAEAQQGARGVARRARHVEADVLPIAVAAEEVAAVDKGCAQRVWVGGFRDDGSRVGEEGDVEEVFGDG